MNTFETMVRMRIDALLEVAGGVHRERDLRAGSDATETTVLAATAGATPETTRPAVTAAAAVSQGDAAPSDDCPECPSAVRAA